MVEQTPAGGFRLRQHMGAWLVEVYDEFGQRFGIARDRFDTKAQARKAAKDAGLKECK